MTGGTLLLTGASIAGVVSATRERVATTTERMRRSTGRSPPRSTATRAPPRA